MKVKINKVINNGLNAYLHVPLKDFEGTYDTIQKELIRLESIYLNSEICAEWDQFDDHLYFYSTGNVYIEKVQ